MRTRLRRNTPGEYPLHHAAILEYVADPRRRSKIVLQHEELPIGPSNEVDPSDVHENTFARPNAVELFQVAGRAKDHRLGDAPFLDDSLTVVEVRQKHVEGRHPLDQPPLDLVPGSTGNHARNQVEREDLLLPLGIGIDRKRHPSAEQSALGEPLPRVELEPAQLLELPDQVSDLFAWGPIPSKELVVGPGQRRVTVEQCRVPGQANGVIKLRWHD